MKNRLLVCWLLLHGLLAGQSAVKKTVCASGCDYTATRAGFTAALSAAAISQASACTPYIIEIAAGAVIEISGNPGIGLPAKSCRQFVTIRSSGAFVDGVRLDPATQSASLATLKAVDYVGALVNIADGAATSYWRFEGIDFWVYGGSNTSPNYYGLILDSDGALGLDPSTRPHHFEIKHCWFRGEPGKRNALNGIGVSGNNIRILDNYFEAWAGQTSEGRSIGIGVSDGPVEVRNNRLTGAAQNVLVGGLPQAKGVLPSFLSFIGNSMGRDPYMRWNESVSDPTMACREGNVWSNSSTGHEWICNGSSVWVDGGVASNYGYNITKTIWEAKVGRGVRFFGNIFQDAFYPLTWTFANFIVINNTSSNGTLAGGVWTSPDQWSTVEDFRVHGNKFTQGNMIFAAGYPGETPCTVQHTAGCLYRGVNNIRIWDNLGYDLADAKDLGTSTFGTGGFAQWAVGAFDMEYRNNTWLTSQAADSGTAYFIGGVFNGNDINDKVAFQQITGQNILRDNVAPITQNGLSSAVNGTPYVAYNGMGECSLALGLMPSVGGMDVRNNVWTNDLNWNWASKQGLNSGVKTPLACNWEMYAPPDFNNPGSDWGVWWSSGTLLQDTWDNVVDPATYKVKEAYRNSGSDGRDPGANIDFVNWATAGAATGEANPFFDMKIRSIRADSNSATLYLTAPSSQACAVELSQSNQFDTLGGSVAYSQTGKDVRANVSGLTPGTYYFVRARCDGYQLESTLLTSP